MAVIGIIEDETGARDDMVEVLESQGYTIIEAEDKESGLEIVKKHKPDLIISDVNMGCKEAGFELLAEIRKDETISNIPVILLTIYSEDKYILKGFQLGAQDYVIKPFNFEELIVRVKTHLELKATREKLEQQNDELLNANRLKSQFLEMAAHDLNSPLTVIGGYAELLEAKCSGNIPILEMLAKIRKNSNRMSHMIKRFLEKTYDDSIAVKLKKTLMDLGITAKTVVDDFSHTAFKKRQQILFTCRSKVLIDGDRLILQQVIENLVSNSIKYSPPGKSIQVTVERNKSQGVLKVKDEGPGFSDDDKEKLFQKYVRLSATSTAGESSTGLGLSICKEFVQLHGGNIRLESRLGKGATFIVEFPLYEYNKMEEELVAGAEETWLESNVNQ